MIGNVTEKQWGARFQLQAIRQAQAAMSRKIGIQQLLEKAEEITSAHHHAMKHSVRTGIIQYDREDRALPCDDDEMQRQRLLCDYIHCHQWGLGGGKAQDEPNHLAAMEKAIVQLLDQKVSEAFTRLSAWNVQSHSIAQLDHGSTQDEQPPASGTEEMSSDGPIEDNSMSEWDIGGGGSDSVDWGGHSDGTPMDDGSDNGDFGELHCIPVLDCE